MLFAALHHHIDRLEAKLDTAIDLIKNLVLLTQNLSQQEHQDMPATDDAIAALTAQVAANTTVLGSAETALNGVAAAIAAAIASASAAGATPAQLAEIQALQTQIANDDAGLAAAIATVPAGA